jgi:hypothetical protein
MVAFLKNCENDCTDSGGGACGDALCCDKANYIGPAQGTAPSPASSPPYTFRGVLPCETFDIFPRTGQVAFYGDLSSMDAAVNETSDDDKFNIGSIVPGSGRVSFSYSNPFGYCYPSYREAQRDMYIGWNILTQCTMAGSASYNKNWRSDVSMSLLGLRFFCNPVTENIEIYSLPASGSNVAETAPPGRADSKVEVNSSFKLNFLGTQISIPLPYSGWDPAWEKDPGFSASWTLKSSVTVYLVEC